jgi:hypothetical protein
MILFLLSKQLFSHINNNNNNKMPIDMNPISPDIAKCWDDPCHETLRKLSYFLGEQLAKYAAKIVAYENNVVAYENISTLIIVAFVILFVWNIINTILSIISMCIGCDQQNNKGTRLIDNNNA